MRASIDGADFFLIDEAYLAQDSATLVKHGPVVTGDDYVTIDNAVLPQQMVAATTAITNAVAPGASADRVELSTRGISQPSWLAEEDSILKN